MSNYAIADRTTQSFAKAYPGVKMDPNCGTIHTTETIGWPGYEGGKLAPNYTARPIMLGKRLDFRAHFPDEMSARALQNDPGGVNTNTANNVQVELVGTCDYSKRKTWKVGTRTLVAGVDYIYWPDAPDWALLGVARFLVDQYKRHGTPLKGPAVWLNYGPDPRRKDGKSPASYGENNGVRMTFAQWLLFTGWCGHMHVPENDHGDPGAFPFARVIAMAKELLNPTPAPAPPTKEVVMHVLVRQKDRPEVWASNGIQRYHLPNPAALVAHQAWMKARGLPITVLVVASLDAYGAAVAEPPAAPVQ